MKTRTNMRYKDLCGQMGGAGWLSHTIVASKTDASQKTRFMANRLKDTKTYQAFRNKLKVPFFDSIGAVNAVIHYTDENGERKEPVLIDDKNELVCGNDPNGEFSQNRRKIAYLADIPLDRIRPKNVHKVNVKRRLEPKIVDPPKNHKGGYEVQTKGEAIKAEKVESKLLNSYRAWLDKRNRKLSVVKYGALECDGYEKNRKNLIEAKASASRENIRMAVGQLLDYAFLGNQGEKPLGKPHKAILLPQKPDPEIEEWLRHLHINVIWRMGKSFEDNASGQFA